jgi:tRNA-splicing endonuclease subunit Sen2
MKGKGLTPEEITAKRRAERKQFKLDRAKAIAAAAAEAETVFNEQGRVIAPGIAPDGTRIIPSAATWKPASASIPSEQSPLGATRDEDEEFEPIPNLEHLQLSLQEAFFLVWALDCLTILHPESNTSFTLAELWNTFQNAYIPSPVPQPNTPLPPRFDNPFLVSYIAYHHYRSLGWVVKSGIKFCVDYLLYKRGPVFQHAEFAIVVIPVYEDPEDQANSPFKLQNVEPFTWSWLSTINRVNSQVQKTLVLSYITIPAESRVSPKVLSSPACFAHYSVREVVLRRFIPARMRD